MTESRQNEAEASTAEEAMLQALLDAVVDAVIVFDDDGILLRASHSVKRVFGWTPKELLGRDMRDLLIEPAHVRFEDRLRRLRDGGLLDSGREPRHIGILHKDGSSVRCDVKSSRIETSGRPPYFIAVLRDIDSGSKAEKKLRRHMAFDLLAAEIATNFIKLSGDDCDRGVNEALAKISRFAGVDRSHIFLSSDDGKSSSVAYEWCAEGVTPVIDSLQDLPFEAFPWVIEKLLAGKTVPVESVAELPPEAASERAIFEANDVKALVMVPLVRDGRSIGMVGFNSLRAERRWTEHDVALLSIVGMIFTSTLIHKQAQEALRNSEERLRTIFEAAADSIFTKDRQLHYVAVNPSMERLFGRSAAELIEKTDRELFGQEAAARIEEVDRRVLDGEVVEEVTSKPVGGEIKTFHIIKVPLRHNSGEIVGLCGIARDITDKHLTEQALRESEERLRAIAENLPCTVFTYIINPDESRTLVYLSPGLEKLIGPKSLAKLGGSVDRFFDLIHPDDIENVEISRADSIGTEDSYDTVYRVMTDSGEYRWIHSLGRPVPQDNGTILWHGMLLDIEQRKQDEAKLKEYSETLEEINVSLSEAKAQAEAATRFKSAFLANISHDIRTPLTAIMGFADILVERLEKPENVETLSIIRSNGEYLLQILSDVLDHSKIEAGKLDLSIEAIRPCRLIKEIQLSMKMRAAEKGLELEIEFTSGIPITIRTDPVRLRQILFNLVGNAIKFTEQGGVRISTRLLAAEEKLQIDIIDTGIGISKKEISRLFKPFTQTKTSGIRKHGGTGLGLAISQRLAEMLGGEIIVESKPGRGSLFSVILPTGSLTGIRIVSGQECLATTEVYEAEVVQERREAPRIRGRILLAEDNPTNQKLIQYILEQAGAEVGLARNGEDAVARILAAEKKGRPFNAVLMDIQMPVLDGLEATRRLRAKGYRGAILALTAHATVADRERCLQAGCDDHIPKPIDRAQLIEMILAQLKAR